MTRTILWKHVTGRWNPHEEILEEAVELCRIFDQVRIINQFVIQALIAKGSETEAD
jgi:hypothetical protein